MEPGMGKVDDLATLATLDERTLLREIRIRYQQDIIYTYIGDILVAVNPYKTMHIYGPEVSAQYKRVQLRSRFPPHIYGVSDNTYQSMRNTDRNQCCVVSGESGAGKTESTKLMVQHVVRLCPQRVKTHLHEKIIQVNPLLEAFGNAQTLMNNNSSRFGKFIELHFDAEGQILGARISEYLLEKSRVVSQMIGERNFHIFYYIFAGLQQSQLKNNLLYRPEDHRILRNQNGGKVFSSDSEFRYQQEMWLELTNIMKVVGFSSEEMNSILAVLAAILHITDIRFLHDYDTDGVYIEDERMLEMACHLLGLLPESLAGTLISNVTHLRGERIVTLKTTEQANDGRDALAKSLYGRLFGWMVRQINYMLRPDTRSHQLATTIGILDIAGFENFQFNSFEQLCINVANEQLQFYFNQHIFQWEMDEYKREGVRGKDIKFISNRPVLDLFLETPLGVFSLLDEESKFPKGSDQTLLDKLGRNLSKKSQFQRPKGHPDVFTINHYAGPVTYHVRGFLEKNRDTLSWNLLDCMKNSDSQFVSDLFFAPLSDTGSLQMNPNAPKRSRKSLLLCKAPDLSRARTESLSKKAGKKLKERAKSGVTPGYETAIRTLSSHFRYWFRRTEQMMVHHRRSIRNSLTDLMAKLLDADPHFVRCIKPNHQKRCNVFDENLVVEQLRYTGVLETVRVRRQGYATRLPHEVFLRRYKILCFPLTSKVAVNGNNCAKLLKKVGLRDWEIGKAKVFLKYWHTEELSMWLDMAERRVVRCQSVIRGFLGRRRVARLLQVAAREAEIVRAFCAHVCNACEETFMSLGRQQDHDAQKFQKAAKQKQEVLRQARAHLRPPSDDRDRPTSPTGRENIYVPTPLVQGNPMYMNHKAIESRSNHPEYRYPVANNSPPLNRPVNGYSDMTTMEPKLGMRRTPAQAVVSPDCAARTPPVDGDGQFEYQTESMKTPGIPHNYDYNDVTHYARRTPPSSPASDLMKPGKVLRHRLLAETLKKYASIDTQIWGKLHYMERGDVVAKFYLREDEVIIDNSTEKYDGQVIGLQAFEDPDRDKKTTKILQKVANGVKLKRDYQGNIYATKLSDCDVIVKGYNDPENQCLSADVIKSLGRLKKEPMKIFDMSELKSHIALELQKPQIDERHLQALSMVSFCFVQNTFDELQTPCWICIINFDALDALGSEKVLSEVLALAHLNLSNAEDIQMRRHWCKLNSRHAKLKNHMNRDYKARNQLPRTPDNEPDCIPSNGQSTETHLNGDAGRLSPDYASTIDYETYMGPIRDDDTEKNCPFQKKNWAKLSYNGQ